MTFTTPKPYVVYCTVAAHTHSGHHFKESTHRVGPASTPEEAFKLAAEDLRAVTHPDTFGGLIGWGPVAPRSYHVFKANWEKIEMPQSRRK